MKLFTLGAFFLCGAAVCSCSKSVSLKASAVAESFGDGEKISAVIIEYPKAIRADSVSVDDFFVEGKTLTAALTNDMNAVCDTATDGRFVVLKLAQQNKWENESLMLGGRPQKHSSEEPHGTPDFSAMPDNPVDLSATVTQTGELIATDGTVFAPSAVPVRTSSAQELVIQDFKKQLFSDAETGATIPYFVYLPADYDKTKQDYPLVFFIPDASANTGIDKTTLTQGNGATVWATPAAQAKHPAIVVAVQYPRALVQSLGALVTDDYVWTPGLTLVYNLLQHILATYRIDKNRVYGTGQSQGCMTNIALSCAHPDLFTAQFLVAGQWNVQEMERLKDKKLWIVVCSGDTKAYPAMNEATALWESAGTKVARSSRWNLKATPLELDLNVAIVRAQECTIHYTVFEGGNHMYTWAVAYNIAGIRDWLFEQVH